MKKFKIFSLAAMALTLGLTSCGEDFLTEEPSSQLPLEGYYTTEARVQEAMVAAYDPMHWFDYFNGWAPLYIVWDSQGDDIYVGGGSTGDQSQLHLISQYKSDPNNSIGGAWSTAYSGINRSIRLIEDAENCEELSDATRKQYIAEGRTLRAWYYLVLWKIWGNVPFYMDNLTFPYVTPQLSESEVYSNIVADLEEVLDGNALPMKQPDEWAGRMTQAAAAMIYADFVMYEKDQSRYSKALSYMEQIISSGKYSLMADYDDLFKYETEYNDEIILDVDYFAKGGKRDWGSANAPGGTVTPALIGIDGLSYNGAEWEFNTGGWGFCTVSKEVYDAYDEGDLRRDIGILNFDKYMEDKWTNEGVKVTYGGRYQNTGYFLRKYLGRPGGNDGNVASGDLNWGNNLHLYRYSETLLNAAELALEGGNSSKAQGYYDQVRQRAGVATKTVSKDNLIDERRLEFVGEGKRYFDLVRSGKAASVLKAGGGVVLQSKRGFNLAGTGFTGECTWGGQAIPERQAWTESKKYIPIPQGEIEACASTEYPLTQNNY